MIGDWRLAIYSCQFNIIFILYYIKFILYYIKFILYYRLFFLGFDRYFFFLVFDLYLAPPVLDFCVLEGLDVDGVG